MTDERYSIWPMWVFLCFNTHSGVWAVFLPLHTLHITAWSSRLTDYTMTKCRQLVTHRQSFKNFENIYVTFWTSCAKLKPSLLLHSHRLWWSFRPTFPKVMRFLSSLRPRQRTSTPPQSEFMCSYHWPLAPSVLYEQWDTKHFPLGCYHWLQQQRVCLCGSAAARSSCLSPSWSGGFAVSQMINWSLLRSNLFNS